MTKYKAVKLTFDLEDEFQLKLYNHLKKRTNGSAYIRTLIHQDLYSNGNAEEVQLRPKNTAPTLNYKNIINNKDVVENVASPIIEEYIKPSKDEDNDIIIDGLI